MDIVSRLKRYIALSGLPTTQFADCAQIPRPTLSQILNGRNRKISNELIGKLHDAFPDLNVMWLMFGDGEPVLATNTQTSTHQNNHNLFDSIDGNADGQKDTAGVPTNTDVADSTQSVTGTEKPAAPAPNTPLDIHESRDNARESHDNTRESHDNVQETYDNTQETHNLLSSAIQGHPARTLTPGSGKKVQSIMVFYDDNSFEIFTPSQS